jgi:hypothetical protein
MEFERVFYKNDFAAGAALLNLYMICKSDTVHFDLRKHMLTHKRWRDELGQSWALWWLYLVRLWRFYHRKPRIVQGEI